MRKLLYICMVCMGVALLQACSEQKRHYVIGVSQCSQDIWRNKLNDELLMGTYFHDDVELRFASADDSDERQIAQVDSLVAQGIDLLIVAPNQMGTLSQAIDRAFDKGIPVIVFDRKTGSQKFTAYIGADNEEMGRQMGEYIATQLGGHGRVLEIMGLKGSSPAIERHRGFTEAIGSYPGIELVASLQGDWTEQSAADAIRQFDGDLSHIDFVFGQNDRMAVGARRALLEVDKLTTKFCGIDGLPGEGGGLECVRDSVLAASYIYPTRGDEVLQLAVDILKGRPFKRENMLMSALVTHDNARVLLMLNDEMQRRTTYLNGLKQKANVYLQRLDTQNVIIALCVCAIVLTLLVALFFLLYRRGKISLRRQRVVSNLWNISTREEKPLQTLSPVPPCREVSGYTQAENSQKGDNAAEI